MRCICAFRNANQMLVYPDPEWYTKEKFCVGETSLRHTQRKFIRNYLFIFPTSLRILFANYKCYKLQNILPS